MESKLFTVMMKMGVCQNGFISVSDYVRLLVVLICISALLTGSVLRFRHQTNLKIFGGIRKDIHKYSFLIGHAVSRSQLFEFGIKKMQRWNFVATRFMPLLIQTKFYCLKHQECQNENLKTP